MKDREFRFSRFARALLRRYADEEMVLSAEEDLAVRYREISTEKGVFRALFDDGLTQIGAMTLVGKLYLYVHYSGGGDTQRYFEMYNILGDPSVAIWIANQPPVAVCQPYEADADENCCITVSTSDIDDDSYDPDALEDIASRLITAIDGEPVTPCEQTNVCGQGSHTVTLTVTDRCGESHSCDAPVQVLNQPPVAMCRSCVGEADENCCILVTVDSLDAGSYDPDGVGDIESLCITEVDGVPVGCQQEVEICGVYSAPDAGDYKPEDYVYIGKITEHDKKIK